MGKLTGIFCPKCDLQEGGRTESRLINDQTGYRCTAGSHKFPNYIDMMNMKPRMEKLQIQEKQPPSSTLFQIWIHPDALATLQQRFPSNFKTTVYSLFNALAGGAILIEPEHVKELHELGISKGREIVGLAKTNLELTAQLKSMQEEMKQYEMISRLLAVAGGGLTNSPAAQAPAIADILANGFGAPDARPPQQPVSPIINTESDTIYEPAAPGSFGASDLYTPKIVGGGLNTVAVPPASTLSKLLKNPPPPR